MSGMTETESRKFQDGSDAIIAAMIEVHRVLGPGLVESSYETALEHELRLRGHHVERQRPIDFDYKGLIVRNAHRLDLIVDHRIVIEIKAVDLLAPIHNAQLLTYLKLTGLEIGLLVNFNVSTLRRGLRRVWRDGR